MIPGKFKHVLYITVKRFSFQQVIVTAGYRTFVYRGDGDGYDGHGDSDGHVRGNGHGRGHSDGDGDGDSDSDDYEMMLDGFVRKTYK